MPVSANLDAVLDKEWENKSLEEILKGTGERPRWGFRRGCGCTAAGVQRQDGGGPGRSKFFRAAQALALLAESAGKNGCGPFGCSAQPGVSAPPSGPPPARARAAAAPRSSKPS